MNPKTNITFTLPAYWASYIINGDSSGMDDSDIEECDAFMERNGNPHFVDVSESYFSWRNDADSLGGDVCDYTAI